MMDTLLFVMICILFPVLVSGAAYCVCYGYNPLQLIPTKDRTIKKSLSWPSGQIYDLFMALPKENRPDYDILSILRALDVKNGGKEKVSSRFRSDYYPFEANWNKKRLNTNDYFSLKEEIDNLNDAVRAQEQALKTARVNGQLQDAEELKARLRDEASIVNTITKELS